MQWAGSAVAVAGLVVAAWDRIGSGGGGAAGLVWVVAGLLGFAGGTLYQKRFGATMDLRTGTAVQLLAAAAVVLPVSLVAGQGVPLPHTASARARSSGSRRELDRRDVCCSCCCAATAARTRRACSTSCRR